MLRLIKWSIVNSFFVWGMILLHLYLFLFGRTVESYVTKSKPVPAQCPFKTATKIFYSPQITMAHAILSTNLQQQSRFFNNDAFQVACSSRDLTLHLLPDSNCMFNSFCHEVGQVSRKRSSFLVKNRHKLLSQRSDSELSSSDSSKFDDNLEIVVMGLSHHNAKVELREKLAVPECEWHSFGMRLKDLPSVREAAVLSTCNRFELYLAGKNQYEIIRDTLNYLSDNSKEKLDPETLRRNMFILSGEDAIWHIMRVAGGLDSLVVGEGQILAQVKKAYEHGIDSNAPAGKVVSRLLHSAITAGKRVRSETGISKGAVSISSAAAEFSMSKIEADCGKGVDISNANIVVFGAGKMARLLLVHLESQGLQSVTVLSRSLESIQTLQSEFPNLNIKGKTMENLSSAVEDANVIFTCTSSTSPILFADNLRTSLANRSIPGGLQIVDISVPRNVHHNCNSLDNVHCYDVDDLKAVVEKNTAKRRREIIEAEIILKDESAKFLAWQQSLGAVPTIAKLQEKAEKMRREELEKATKRLSALNPKDLETVEKITKGIVAKLLHGPMYHLRQQGGGRAAFMAIQQVQQAFQLE